jgi:O-antigen/teichoic acid export membrane protein
LGMTVLRGVVAMAFATLAASGVGIWIVYKRYFRITDYRSSGRSFRTDILVFGLPLVLVSNILLVMTMDAVFVAKWAVPLQFGYYALAKQLVLYSTAIVSPVIHGFGPRFSAAHSIERNELIRLHDRACMTVAAMLLGGGLAVWATAPFILKILSGPDFVPAAPALRALIVWAIAYGLAYLNLAFLVYLGRPGVVCLISMLGAVADVGLLYLWTPTYGAVGAGAGAALSQFAPLIIAWLAVRHELNRRYVNRE